MSGLDFSSARPTSWLWPWAIIALSAAFIVGMVCVTYLEAKRMTPPERPPTALALLVDHIDPTAPLMPQMCAVLLGTKPHAHAAVELCAAQAAAGWPSSLPILVSDNLNGVGGDQ